MDNDKNKFSYWLKLFFSIFIGNIVLYIIFITIAVIIGFGGIGDPNVNSALEFIQFFFILATEYHCYKKCLKFFSSNKNLFKKNFLIVSILNISSIVFILFN